MYWWKEILSVSKRPSLPSFLNCKCLSFSPAQPGPVLGFRVDCSHSHSKDQVCSVQGFSRYPLSEWRNLSLFAVCTESGIWFWTGVEFYHVLSASFWDDHITSPSCGHSESRRWVSKDCVNHTCFSRIDTSWSLFKDILLDLCCLCL
jgi:hypothetical protein